jgi:hypothetical protein
VIARATTLEREIREARLSISSDGYPMSIGELTNLYKDGELIIRPEFQRFFRWSSTQKSRLIESILLGIPLPSIFVAQSESGAWELVDGLQRVSTILELQGELKNPEGKLKAPLVLESTKYLPALEGRVWQGEDPSDSFSEAQRLDIKRSKIDIKIIKRESSKQAKFDLFQRLNAYGSPLTSQEIRSALLVAASPDFFVWLERLSSLPAFIECTQLSDRLIEERFDLELVIRFLILHNRREARLTLSSLRDLPQILDDESIAMATEFPRGSRSRQSVFEKTFSLIAEHGGEQIFRRWDAKKSEFKGSFLNTAFEIFGLGLGYHVANDTPHRTDLVGLAKSFWSRSEMQKGFATGRSTESRLVEFIPLGRSLTASRAKSNSRSSA